MTLKTSTLQLFLTGLLTAMLTSCFQPPYNHFQPDNTRLRRTAVSAGIGAAVGSAVGTATGNTLPGLAIGTIAGTVYGLHRSSQKELIRELQKQDIQFEVYGETSTLIVPTDKYFIFDSARLNDLCYQGLYNIIRLLCYYPESTIYVAGFTDDVGSRHHKKKLSQARAEAMLTFLWAHNINAQRLQAEGYGSLHPVSDNDLIHGSAQNRRLEIQWHHDRLPQAAPRPFIGMMK